MNEFMAVITSKHDEGLATLRDWIIRNGVDEASAFFPKVFEATESTDPTQTLIGFFAVLGFCVAMRSAVEAGVK